MAASFDDFFANVRAKYPSASIDQIGAAYKKSTGEDPVFSSGPTREDFTANVLAQIPDRSPDEIDKADDKYYKLPLGTETLRSLKRGAYQLGASAGDIINPGSDLIGLGQTAVGTAIGDWGRREAAAPEIAPSPAAQSRFFQQKPFDINAPISSLLDANWAGTYGDPSWWAGHAPEIALSQA